MLYLKLFTQYTKLFYKCYYAKFLIFILVYLNIIMKDFYAVKYTVIFITNPLSRVDSMVLVIPQPVIYYSLFQLEDSFGHLLCKAPALI